MIKVTGIEIRNFRSYKDRENIVTGIKDLNIVVGKNNVGKTNILRAIYLFFNPENYKLNWNPSFQFASLSSDLANRLHK